MNIELGGVFYHTQLIIYDKIGAYVNKLRLLNHIRYVEKLRRN